jgi:nicotinate phosphoribosyltransferase
MAHAFVQAHDSEETAFERFALARPKGLTLLIDTYDTERSAELVVRLAPRLSARGIAIAAVRIDSGDLADHARKVRRILDEGGLSTVSIFASGGLDENDLVRFACTAAPIDGYGIGTSLTTSSDAPSLDCAYKLQEYDGKPRLKRSEGKATWPGRKQVFRRYDADGVMIGDTVALEGAAMAGEPLLRPAMRSGRRLNDQPDLAAARRHAARSLLSLPLAIRNLEPLHYPVQIGADIRALAASI